MRHLRRRRSLIRRSEGQSAVEFAMILPFFLLFILLAVEFGLLMWSAVSVANAAREGARFAAANCSVGACDVASIRTRVIERSGGVLRPGDEAEITVAWPEGTLRGDPVAVRIDHTHTLLFLPNLAALVGGGAAGQMPVQACSTMRLESDDSGSPPPGSVTC
jgi:Flp pilus assembly protein TadG